jgi:cellulose synthase/poly-beta-1,6-N-acetylglucosamine synthase-like glycosyltransferase
MQIILFSYGMYLLCIGVFGLRTKTCSVDYLPKNKFAILIPAHNEENVIGNLIRNLNQLDYPHHLFDIYVIADNCTDNTAEIANSLGAIVLNRFNNFKKGKGFALDWALEKLKLNKTDSNEINNYDAVVIFDADNLVSGNFLKVMNNKLVSGENIIQSYIDSKNPNDSWITASFSIMFWLNNRFALMSRYNLGLCGLLAGTGMCISTQVLKEVGWATSTLTEDLEYSMKALLHNYKTTYAHEAKIYDEKPLSFLASSRQRLRWARGQIDVTIKYLPLMFYRAIKERNFIKLESSLRMCQLFMIIIAGIILLLGIFKADLITTTSVYYYLNGKFPLVAIFLLYIPYALPILLLSLDSLPLGPFKYLIFFPIFAYSWYLIYFYAFFTFKNTTWMPTKHSRALDIEQLET